jgi:hypothetical protein
VIHGDAHQLKILAATAAFLRPGGHVAITIRPWREHAELIGLPSQILACGIHLPSVPHRASICPSNVSVNEKQEILMAWVEKRGADSWRVRYVEELLPQPDHATLVLLVLRGLRVELTFTACV